MAAKKKVPTAAGKPPSKSEIFGSVADDTGLTRKEVGAVFDSLTKQMKRSLGGRGGSGMFNLPGLMKIKVVRKPATKARQGINPFTGEQMMFKAKPARRTVKVTALKGLKDMV